ncbi:MAG: AAA family ATPase [Patescibacteria group bacterium]
MKLIVIFGPPAVGKMTVGQELEKITNLKLFHNHMSMEVVLNFFNYKTPAFEKLVDHIREEIFKEVASSDLGGLIFTYTWFFEDPKDKIYLDNLIKIFKDKSVDIYYVELEADLDVRLKRNKTENRLKHKPSKNDIDNSEKYVLETNTNHRMNSMPGEVNEKNYLRINNTDINPVNAALLIKKEFNL